MTLRAFIAIDPSEEVINRLSVAIREFARKTRGFRWARPEAMHVTLRFLGEITEEALAQIDDRLAVRIPVFPQMSLNVAGLGFFPDPQKPRIAWAGVTGDIQGLTDLQKAVHEEVVGLAAHDDKGRDFTPHLTLARIPNFRGSAGVSDVLQAAPKAHFGAFTADRVFLYKSRLTPEGASYTKLKEYALGRTHGKR